jgi:predicted nucleic acid-binding protein
MSVFLDSNVVLYALGGDESKREIARGLLASQPYLFTQVVNECSHVLRRKQRLAPDEIARHMESILELARLVEVGMAEIRRA